MVVGFDFVIFSRKFHQINLLIPLFDISLLHVSVANSGIFQQLNRPHIKRLSKTENVNDMELRIFCLGVHLCVKLSFVCAERSFHFKC